MKNVKVMGATTQWPGLKLLVALLVLLGCSNEVKVKGSEETDFKVVGYLFGRQPFTAEEIAVEKLTHINYAFADIVDGKLASYLPYDSVNFAILNQLKRRNPDLKILVSVGGWTHSKGFSDAALTEASRARFAASAVAFARYHQLDGIDLDWEYPGQIGDNNPFRPEDKQNFTLMLKELRRQLDLAGKEDNKNYLTTIASATNQSYLDHTEMDKAQAYLNFINIMTYDFAGGWIDTTGHHSNLFATRAGLGSRTDTRQAVEQHIQAGVPAHKIVVGVPFYGRGWRQVNPAAQGLNQPASRDAFSLPYHTIVDSLIDRNGFTRSWDEEALAPYLWNDSARTFITYEDTVSLRHKVEFVKSEGLGGIMFWQYHADTTGQLLQTIHAHR